MSYRLRPFKFIFGLVIATLMNLAPLLSYACTTVFANNNSNTRSVARTMDLFTSDLPMLVVQPRGLQHSGETGEHALTWTSRYGSVVVTAFHSDAASDGINEKGLSAHLLYLSGSEYPTPKPKAPTLSNLMWAQYVLDHYKTVAEALKGTQELQIIATELHGKKWPIHLVLEDATGDSAVLEFLKGQLHVYHGPQYRVVTNEPAYSIQLANLTRYHGFGGTLPLPGDPDPLSRFVRVSSFLKTLPQPKTELEAISGVLSVIRTAMVPFGAVDTSGNETEDAWATRWVTVADVTHKIYYFNSTSAPNIIWIDLNAVNFKEGAQVLSIDPSAIHLEGDITQKLSPRL